MLSDRSAPRRSEKTWAGPIGASGGVAEGHKRQKKSLVCSKKTGSEGSCCIQVAFGHRTTLSLVALNGVSVCVND